MARTDRPEKAWKDWIAQVRETALDPDQRICDPHHHIWPDNHLTGWPYLLHDLHKDTGAGHDVQRTVFVECRTQYRDSGPVHLRPVGETTFIADIAEQSARSGNAEIAGIVAHADLSLGDAVEEVLHAHAQAARGRFKGIRYTTAQNAHPPLAMRASAAMDDPRFRDGVRKVGDMGYTFDAMVYHPQLPELREVAQACPQTRIVINHLGGFLGTGPYRDHRETHLREWEYAMTRLAKCPNVYLKVGGIGMPMMGYRWDKQSLPATSEDLARVWGQPIRHVIDKFGPERCMFESNYPVDMRGAGYVVLWNAFKRISADYSAEEKDHLFHDTAVHTYRLS
jgi:predicted TIM-barrel fold metal-dependent hydrolase